MLWGWEWTWLMYGVLLERGGVCLCLASTSGALSTESNGDGCWRSPCFCEMMSGRRCACVAAGSVLVVACPGDADARVEIRGSRFEAQGSRTSGADAVGRGHAAGIPCSGPTFPFPAFYSHSSPWHPMWDHHAMLLHIHIRIHIFLWRVPVSMHHHWRAGAASATWSLASHCVVMWSLVLAMKFEE